MPKRFNDPAELQFGEFIGIDVSKDELMVGSYPGGATFKKPNNEKGRAEITEILATIKPPRVVLEASGGYERAILDALYAAEVPVARVNPRKTSQFGQGVGGPAKTDPLDSVNLARFASHVQVPLYVPTSPQLIDLQSLVMRRDDLVKMRTQDRLRSEKAVSHRASSIEIMVEFIQKEIERIEELIANSISTHDEWIGRVHILCSVPGVGLTTAHVLIAWMPELGAYERGSIAHLAGLAPITHQSGNHTKKSRITGGRPIVRRAMFMATLSAIRFNPTIKEKYEGFLKDGKPKKVALIACARTLLLILNALVRKNELWSESGRR